MNHTVPRLRIAALLAAAVLVVAGCEQRNDAIAPGQLPGTLAGALSRDNAAGVGTDEAIEDSEVTAKVREAILADPQLQSQHIEVQTEDAAVTLTGTVDSPALRERAVELAGSVNGVVQVQEKLEVRS